MRNSHGEGVEGRFVDRDGEIQFMLVPADEIEAGKDIVITQSDIRPLWISMWLPCSCLIRTGDFSHL